MIVLACDPGLTGAVAWMDHRGRYGVADIPTIGLPGKGRVRRRIDGRGLILLLRDFCRPGEPVMAVCESVRAMGGKNNSLQTQGSLTRSLGAIEAVFDILRVSPTLIEPMTWKRFYGLKSDKKAAMNVARKLFPKAELHLAKHENRCESLLIANYAIRKLT